MIGPQWGLDYTRSHSCNSDPQLLVEISQCSDQTVDSMFCRAVNRCCEICVLAGNTGDMDDVLWATAGPVLEEMGDGQLCGANGVCDIDVYQCIAATSDRVLAWISAGWSPEVAPVLCSSYLDLCRSVAVALVLSYRLVDSSARANNIDLAKLFLCDFKHAFELQPVYHVGLLEYHSGRSRGVLISQHLRLRTQS